MQHYCYQTIKKTIEIIFLTKYNVIYGRLFYYVEQCSTMWNIITLNLTLRQALFAHYLLLIHVKVNFINLIEE